MKAHTVSKIGKLLLRRAGDNGGFTLAGTMVGIGIGMIVTMGLIAGLSYTYKARKDLDSKGITQGFLDRMVYATAKRDRCTKFVRDATAQLDLAGAETPLVFEGLREGDEIAPDIHIDKLRLIRQMDIAAGTSTEGANLYKYAARVQVRLRIDNADTPVGRERSIPVRVITNLAGAVQSCAPAVDSVRMCEEFGGLVDANAPMGDAQACKPQKHCQYGGSYAEPYVVRGSTLPGGYPNTLTGAYSCPQGFTAQRAGSVGVALKCGKTCIEMKYFNSYVCARCGPIVQAQPPTVADANTIVSDFGAINQGATELDQRLTDQQNRLNGITP